MVLAVGTIVLTARVPACVVGDPLRWRVCIGCGAWLCVCEEESGGSGAPLALEPRRSHWNSRQETSAVRPMQQIGVEPAGLRGRRAPK
jgi:hypothetical protein